VAQGTAGGDKPGSKLTQGWVADVLVGERERASPTHPARRARVLAFMTPGSGCHREPRGGSKVARCVESERTWVEAADFSGPQ